MSGSRSSDKDRPDLCVQRSRGRDRCLAKEYAAVSFSMLTACASLSAECSVAKSTYAPRCIRCTPVHDTGVSEQRSVVEDRRYALASDQSDIKSVEISSDTD